MKVMFVWNHRTRAVTVEPCDRDATLEWARGCWSVSRSSEEVIAVSEHDYSPTTVDVVIAASEEAFRYGMTYGSAEGVHRALEVFKAGL